MTIGPTPISLRSPRAIAGLVILIGFALVPLVAGYAGQSFYVTVATRILVFQNGEVIETGTFAELVQRGGFFTELVNAQFAQPR